MYACMHACMYVCMNKVNSCSKPPKIFQSVGNQIPNMVDHEKTIKPPIRLNQFILIHVLYAWNVENNMNKTANSLFGAGKLWTSIFCG